MTLSLFKPSCFLLIPRTFNK